MNPFEKNWDKPAVPTESPPKPKNNLEGLLGPRCRMCSGLGEVMLTKFNREHEDQPIGGTTKCQYCKGSGIEPLTPQEERELLGRLRENQ